MPSVTGSSPHTTVGAILAPDAQHGGVAPLTDMAPKTSLRSNICWKYWRLLSAACQGMYSVSWLRNRVVFRAKVTLTYLALPGVRAESPRQPH